MNSPQTAVAEPQTEPIDDTLAAQSTLDASQSTDPESSDDRGTRVARLVLEDFAVTQLLSRGRALRLSLIHISSPRDS